MSATTNSYLDHKDSSEAEEIKMMESYLANCSCNPYESFDCMCNYYRGKLEQLRPSFY